ncbi:hypothetical protein M0802_007186 [Mischocyttarus mexicanus]|nr:hypothetical protein M0802_007186 [Mischocyttarus mexicanus]
MASSQCRGNKANEQEEVEVEVEEEEEEEEEGNLCPWIFPRRKPRTELRESYISICRVRHKIAFYESSNKMDTSPTLSIGGSRARAALLTTSGTGSGSADRRVVFLTSQTVDGSGHETKTWPHHWSPHTRNIVVENNYDDIVNSFIEWFARTRKRDIKTERMVGRGWMEEEGVVLGCGRGRG